MKQEASKLKKMKMPSKAADDVSALDMGADSPEEQAAMSPDESDQDEPADAQEPSELEHVSDEDLVAEIRKRGLMAELEASPHSEEGEEDAVPYKD